MREQNKTKKANRTLSMSVTGRHHAQIIKTGLIFGHLGGKYNHHNVLTGHKANEVCIGKV